MTSSCFPDPVIYNSFSNDQFHHSDNHFEHSFPLPSFAQFGQPMRLRGRYTGLVTAGWLRVSFSIATSTLRDLISFSSTLKLLISLRIGFSFALFLGLFGCSTSGVSKTFTRACLPNLCFRSASLFAARFNFSTKPHQTH